MQLLRERRTVRDVSPTPVPSSLVETLIEAACWAPSAHNSQPWRFVVVRTREARARLAEAMAGAFRADLQADGERPEQINQRVSASLARLKTAPVLLIPCLCPSDLQVYPDPARQSAEHTMGVQSVAAAVQNLLLAAADAGLGAGWMCAPLFCPEVVRQTLRLPAGWEPQALVTIGWPLESPRPPERRDVSGVTVSR